MSFLNASIPPIECWVRAEYMRQHRDSHGLRLPCVIFGLTSLPGQTPLFHFQMEDGGLWWRMPISAFCHIEDAPVVALEELCLWDSFGYDLSVTRFDWLINARMEYRTRDKKQVAGRYLFTIDWADPGGCGIAESPGHHKCGHLIARDDGNYAIQPNNRLLSFNSAFTSRYGRSVIERMISDRIYTVEQNAKWTTVDEKYDYDYQEVK